MDILKKIYKLRPNKKKIRLYWCIGGSNPLLLFSRSPLSQKAKQIVEYIVVLVSINILIKFVYVKGRIMVRMKKNPDNLELSNLAEDRISLMHICFICECQSETNDIVQLFVCIFCFAFKLGVKEMSSEMLKPMKDFRKSNAEHAISRLQKVLNFSFFIIAINLLNFTYIGIMRTHYLY